MDIINNLLVPSMWPSGVWESIIKWFAGVGSIGLAIILMTICIKILMFPLDFWQKKVSRQMTANQAIMKPELDEIQAKYGKNPQVMQQKQQEVYRKYNAQKNMSGGCVAMLVYMIVTMAIFFTLFAGLRNISTSQINYEYYTLEQTYVVSYNEAITNGQTTEEAVITAQNEVATKYDEIREGFLSIKNIWRPDNWSSVFPSSSEFVKSTNIVFKIYEYQTSSGTIKYIYLSTNANKLTDANNVSYIEPYTDLDGNAYLVKNTGDGAINPTTIEIGGITYNVIYPEIDEKHTNYVDATANGAKTKFLTDFETVTAGIQSNYKGQWNGFLILVILAGAITFLSSWFSTLGLKTRDAKGNEIKGARPKPTMGIILAMVMVFFTISYTSAFAIYIITNSLVAMLLNFITNLILNKLEERKNKNDSAAADYVRK